MTSAGPPPASTSTDSRTSFAFPMAKPSGTFMFVRRADVATPASSPRATIVRASSRLCSMSLRKAPDPNFTSRTSAEVPSAIFLLMIEEAMRGIASTVAVMSRSA